MSHLQAALPEAVVSHSVAPDLPPAGSAKILGARPQQLTAPSVQEPSALGAALAAAHRSCLGLKPAEELVPPSDGPATAPPSALETGKFLPLPKPRAASAIPTSFRSLPDKPVGLSADDWSLVTSASKASALPAKASVPMAVLLTAEEASRRSLSDAAVGEQITAGLASLLCAPDSDGNASLRDLEELDLTAVRSLLFALSEIFSRLLGTLSASYFNSVLIRRDRLLAVSSLDKPARMALRASPLSTSSLFGGRVGPTVKSAADKRRDDLCLSDRLVAARPVTSTPNKRFSSSQPESSKQKKFKASPSPMKKEKSAKPPPRQHPRGGKGAGSGSGRKQAPQ